MSFDYLILLVLHFVYRPRPRGLSSLYQSALQRVVTVTNNPRSPLTGISIMMGRIEENEGRCELMHEVACHGRCCQVLLPSCQKSSIGLLQPLQITAERRRGRRPWLCQTRLTTNVFLYATTKDTRLRGKTCTHYSVPPLMVLYTG